MLITQVPYQLSERFWMLGNAAYPIYLYASAEQTSVLEGGISALGPVLVEQIDSRRLAPSGLAKLVVTHAHPDHVMAIPFLRQKYPDLKVVASQAAADTLSNPKALTAFAQIDNALAQALHEAGQLDHSAAAPSDDPRLFAVDQIVREGDAIEVAPEVTFQVLETPGHSPCSISLFEPAKRYLVVSDATGYWIPADDYWWPNYFSDYAAYVASMERLSGLGVEVLCLSHNAAITGAEEIGDYFRRAIEATRAYHQRIIDEINRGRSVRQLAEELGREVYEKTQLLPLEFFQKNCGVLVKQSLRHEGIAPEK